MRVLVYCANGLQGQPIVHQLLRSDHQVRLGRKPGFTRQQFRTVRDMLSQATGIGRNCSDGIWYCFSGSGGFRLLTRLVELAKELRQRFRETGRSEPTCGCLRCGTGPLRFRRPCGSRPEGLARRCRRPLHSRVPRTPTCRPVACRTRLAWRSERPRRRRRRRCRQTRWCIPLAASRSWADRPISAGHCVNAAARLPIPSG